MTTVLITGATGFIGKSLLKRLSLRSSLKLLAANSRTTSQELKKMLYSADFVYHLAAVHRPSEESHYIRINFEFTEFILGVLKMKTRPTRLLFTSSIHAESNSSYGLSKKLAEEIIEKQSTENLITSFVRLPHVFGPGGKPNYTSVLHTICFSIRNSRPFSINDCKVQLDFLYIDDLVDILEDLLFEKIKSADMKSLLCQSITRISLEELLYIILAVDLKTKVNVDFVSKQFIKQIESTLDSYSACC